MGLFDMFRKVPRYEGEIIVKAPAQETREAIKGCYQGLTGFAGLQIIDTPERLQMQDPVNKKNTQDYFFQNASVNHDSTIVRIIILCPEGGNAQSFFSGVVERMSKKFETAVR